MMHSNQDCYEGRLPTHKRYLPAARLKREDVLRQEKAPAAVLAAGAGGSTLLVGPSGSLQCPSGVTFGTTEHFQRPRLTCHVSRAVGLPNHLLADGLLHFRLNKIG